MTERYLEDFAVGQTYGSGRLRVDADRVKSFATEFDPQPFHMDEEAARGSISAARGKRMACRRAHHAIARRKRAQTAGGIVGWLR